MLVLKPPDRREAFHFCSGTLKTGQQGQILCTPPGANLGVICAFFVDSISIL
jgi:hypothetical protein